jgi:hypothetical protein
MMAELDRAVAHKSACFAVAAANQENQQEGADLEK